MTLDTKFGVVCTPREECVFCIASNCYMRCTMCEFKDELIKCAMKAKEAMEW